MFPPKKGNPKPTPAGPGGKFDPNDSPGKDENGDGIFGRPVKRSTNPDQKAGSKAPKSNKALDGLKKAKP